MDLTLVKILTDVGATGPYTSNLLPELLLSSAVFQLTRSFYGFLIWRNWRHNFKGNDRQMGCNTQHGPARDRRPHNSLHRIMTFNRPPLST